LTNQKTKINKKRVEVFVVEQNNIGPKKERTWLQEWVRKDFWYILICMLAIAACVYTYNDVGNKIQECNVNWATQLTECGCICTKCPYIFEDVQGYNPDTGMIEDIINAPET